MAAPIDFARQLLALARDDEAATRAMISVPAVSDAIVCFHAQQAVEKALKAVLATRAFDFPYTHDLEGLIEMCEAEGFSLPAELADVDRLTPYGVQLRYGVGDPGTVDRKAALQLATAAVAFASSLVDTPPS